MNPLVVTMLGALLRAVLLGWFGSLIERGIWTRGEVETLAVGIAGFLATLVWALWKHYRTRLKFLVALDAVPGTPETEIDARVKVGQGGRGLLVVLALLPVVSACGPKTKPTLVRTDAAVYESIKALHDTAVVLGRSGLITPAQELRIQEAILPVAKLGESTTRVLAAWKSGPTPPELRLLVAEMRKLTEQIILILPGEAQAKAALLERVAVVHDALAAVLVVTGGF